MGETAAAYTPGVCNINRMEITKRRMTGHIGLIVFIVVLALLLVFDVSRYYRLFLFLPAMLAATGYLQARNHFCVGFAREGKQNAAEGSVNASDVTDETAKASDRRKARHMNLQSAGIALIATGIFTLLPHF
jgi:hypothetical protein